ncbi:MAG: hypothetical protein IPG39_19395 [Bacteroidetes bacterium]|nr:hypothetical protein [Bacteroidota bacterium]
MYDNATNVGIGVGASPNTAMKVHMQGDMYVQHNMGAGTPKGGDIFMNDATGNVERILSMYGLVALEQFRLDILQETPRLKEVALHLLLIVYL